MGWDVINGDCRDVMRGMDENSVDAIVTDPPYGLSFIGKGWDKGVPGVEFWEEALRVAKPGSHLLAFGGTRMVHRLAVAIEDAGWEIRDRIHWVYGSGFPKSLDVSKAIDRSLGAERENRVVREIRRKSSTWATGSKNGMYDKEINRITESDPVTEEAGKWDGWGTALKPAVEPIILARKPFRGTVAANVLEHGTGAINVDGCRVETNDVRKSGGQSFGAGHIPKKDKQVVYTGGRWPANLIHDGSDEATSGMGAASRYFYCPKASKKDRDAGLIGGTQTTDDGRNAPIDNPYLRGETLRKNHHPTVKPTDLMAYLCRMITPPGGTVLDPFNGSGSTGKAATREGFNYIGIELDNEYAEIARQRIGAVEQGVA